MTDSSVQADGLAALGAVTRDTEPRAAFPHGTRADASGPQPEAPPQATAQATQPPEEEPAADDELLCTFCGLRACWTR